MTLTHREQIYELYSFRQFINYIVPDEWAGDWLGITIYATWYAKESKYVLLYLVIGLSFNIHLTENSTHKAQYMLVNDLNDEHISVLNI